jgi:uncharacterized protein
MVPLIAERREEVAAICRRFHVRRLEVFGSAAGGGFDPARSDIDFLVEFEPEAPGSALGTYLGLKEALEALFGRPVDLVMPRAVKNPYMKAEIVRTREPLYAA